MSITFQLPLPVPFIGPGCVVGGVSDVPDLLLDDAHWTLTISFSDDTAGAFIHHTIKSQLYSFRWQVLVDDKSTGPLTQIQPKTGDNVFLIAQLFNGQDAAPVDVRSVQVPWDPVAQAAFLTTQATTGGFSSEDRVQLQATAAAVTADLTDRTRPPDLTAVPIGRLFSPHALIWSERVGPFILAGEGVLVLADRGQRGIWQGLRYFFTRQPPGAGLEPGVSIEFERRVVQLAPICILETNGEEVFNPIIDANSDGEFVNLEDLMFSGRIGYSVTPGFEVTLFMYRYAGTG